MRNLKTLFIFVLAPLFCISQNTIFWKVTSPNTQKVSYLLGTFHIIGNTFIDSLPVIKEKLLGADLAAFETQLDREKIATAYNARKGSDNITKILSKEDMDLVNQMIAYSKVDVTKYTPGEIFVKAQAYYPTYMCGIKNSKDTWERMDGYLIDVAKKAGRKMHYFESDSLQIEKLTALTKTIDWKFFEKNIRAVLDKYKKPVDEKSCQLTVQYKSFNLDYNFKGECQSDALLKDRNEKWMQQLPALLDNNNCFIAVGLMHYFNKCGVIEQLRKLGYTIEPVSLQ
jgi:uncharacterized protein YbaP (TraB family)